MSGRAGPSGRNRYAGVGVSVGRTGVAVEVVVGVTVTVGVSVGVSVAVSVGVAVEAAVGVGVAVGVPVEVAVGIGVHVGVNAAVEVSVGTTDSETTGWGMDVPGPQAPIPIALRMIIIPITDLGFFHMSLNRPSSHCKPRIT
jgi:hypothetical protein